MGQIVLGFRSLLIKAAVFFVMAAALAWILGGALSPRPPHVRAPPIEFDGARWCWRLTAGGSGPQPISWTLLRSEDAARWTPYDRTRWAEVLEPVVAGGTLLVGGRLLEAIGPDGRAQPASGPDWILWSIPAGGSRTARAFPDRLALERQVARARAGLPIQAAEDAMQDRPAVLDPPGDGARRGVRTGPAAPDAPPADRSNGGRGLDAGGESPDTPGGTDGS